MLNTKPLLLSLALLSWPASTVAAQPVGYWTTLQPSVPTTKGGAIYEPNLKQTLYVTDDEVWAWNGTDLTLISQDDHTFYERALAYHPGIGKIVSFGGHDRDSTSANESSETRLFDGSSWSNAASGPAQRFLAHLTYDENLQKLVLDGGQSNATNTNDMWTFDGTTWKEVETATTMPDISRALVFDSKRKTLVLFGTMTGSDLLSIYEFEKGDFVKKDDVTYPGFIWSASWDPANQRIVLCAGDKLYAYDSNGWKELLTMPRPYDAMAYDTDRSRFVFFERENRLSLSPYVGEWTGTEWTQVRASNRGPVGIAKMAYNKHERHAVLVTEDLHVTEDNPDGVTWLWNGDDWSTSSGRPEAAGDDRLVLAYDEARKVVVGLWNRTAIQEFDANTWSIRTTISDFPATHASYSGSHGGVILHASGTTSSRTGIWNGTTFKELEGDQPTSVRDAFAAIDPLRNVFVQFGGYLEGSIKTDETWELHGTSWAQVFPTTSPAERGGGGLAFDSERGVLVLFGGYREHSIFDYDGVTWTAHAPTDAPQSFRSESWFYEEHRRRMVFRDNRGGVYAYTVLGESCDAPQDCATGICLNGVCCDRTCDDTCTRCAIEEGGPAGGSCVTKADAGLKCEGTPTGDGGVQGDAGTQFDGSVMDDGSIAHDAAIDSSATLDGSVPNDASSKSDITDEGCGCTTNKRPSTFFLALIGVFVLISKKRALRHQAPGRVANAAVCAALFCVRGTSRLFSPVDTPAINVVTRAERASVSRSERNIGHEPRD